MSLHHGQNPLFCSGLSISSVFVSENNTARKGWWYTLHSVRQKKDFNTTSPNIYKQAKQWLINHPCQYKDSNTMTKISHSIKLLCILHQQLCLIGILMEFHAKWNWNRNLLVTLHVKWNWTRNFWAIDKRDTIQPILVGFPRKCSHICIVIGDRYTLKWNTLDLFSSWNSLQGFKQGSVDPHWRPYS